jgi:parvulin-like peptidyl-prolyl isomerase
MLAEAAGAVVLEEVILGRVLERECAVQSVVVAERETQFERDLLLTTLASAARASAADGEQLLREVRVSRGLGDRRFTELLRRNAMLRALVNKAAGPAGVVVSPDDLDQAFALKYGPRVGVRLILVRSQDEAAAVMKRLDAGEKFGDVAATASVDPSRLRGGLLDPISPVDTSYPLAVRRAIEETETGKHSQPVMVTWEAQPGFAIVRVEERLPGREVDRTSVEKEVEAEVRAVRERALMDRLARRLIDEAAAKLSVLDPNLEWSWRTRREAGR